MNCSARRNGDEMHCHRCGLQWSVNDNDPPSCVPAGTLAIAEIRRMIAESKLRDPAGWRKLRR